MSEKAREKNELMQRIITGIAIVVIIGVLVWTGPAGFFILMLFINHVALSEHGQLIRLAGVSVQIISALMGGALMVIMACLVSIDLADASIFLLLLPVPAVVFSIELFRPGKTPFQNAALTLSGMLMISLPLALFTMAAFLPLHPAIYHRTLVLGYFIILWLGDSGALFTGKLAGKHKLFYRISPNKTWEGSAGGLVCAGTGAVINYYLLGHLTLEQWLELALIIHITGSFGDLAKSMLKRNAGVKDSGKLFPGHGGMLDRFDSLMGSAPFTFLYLLLYV